MAQQTPPAATESPSEPCRVYALDTAADEPSELRASCRGRGVMLGRASQFQAIDSEVLEATLVDIRLDGERRIVLLSLTDEGLPLVEDLTGQLALAAGRGPMSSLAGAEIDLAAFARTGEIGVRGGPEDNGPAKAEKVDVGPQLAAERARRADSGTSN